MAERSSSTASVPHEIKAKLIELDQELAEGDITRKGYEKRKAKLLAPFIVKQQQQRQKQQPQQQPASVVSGGRSAPPGAYKLPYHRDRPEAPRPHKSQNKRRRDRPSHRDNADRYRSDVREEAVREALARQKQIQPAVPMPSKRSSLMTNSTAVETPPDTSTDEEDSQSSSLRGHGSQPFLEYSPSLASNRSSSSNSSLGGAVSVGPSPSHMPRHQSPKDTRRHPNGQPTGVYVLPPRTKTNSLAETTTDSPTPSPNSESGNYV
uniref:Disco-interacting protein 2 homolog A-like n=1 Tax=Saccoglossus kowalevskii TaxID=10224 RepID=A0ABM0MIK2_SACKO|nr:PREDICTED: disco-interacting protein 2 homolog A-like [Saccoglossus kowalevskii]